MKRYSFLLVLGLLMMPRVGATDEDSPTSLVAKGNELYEQGKYEEARDVYLQLSNSGIQNGSGVINGHLAYNLGNTYFRLKQYGKAISQYRHALKEFPRDPDIAANLSLARKQVIDKIDDQRGEALIGHILYWNKLFSLYELQVTFFVTYTVFWILFAFGKFGNVRRVTGILAILLFVPAFCTQTDRLGNPLLVLPYFGHYSGSAVITSPEVKAYSGNSETFQVVFLLHDGAELEIGEIRGDWVEVLLPEGRKGWVKSNELDIV